jgi:hypothetical protein
VLKESSYVNRQSSITDQYELLPFETTDYEWLRAFTALSRSGYVTDDIRAGEQAWTPEIDGDPAAFGAVRNAPGYPAYAKALRSRLRFSLTLYRVTTATAYEQWKATRYSKPVGTTFNREFAEIAKETLPSDEKLVLITGSVTNPEAILMRGRIEVYELVVDSARVEPVNVKLLDG